MRCTLSSGGLPLEPLFAGVCSRLWSALLPLIKAALWLIGNWSSLFNSHRSDIMAAGKRSPWQFGYQKRWGSRQRVYWRETGNFTPWAELFYVLDALVWQILLKKISAFVVWSSRVALWCWNELECVGAKRVEWLCLSMYINVLFRCRQFSA